jgi:hypothetical protein
MKLLSLITLIIVLLTSCSTKEQSPVESVTIHFIESGALLDVPLGTLQEFRSYRYHDTVTYNNEKAIVVGYNLNRIN